MKDHQTYFDSQWLMFLSNAAAATAAPAGPVSTKLSTSDAENYIGHLVTL